MNENATATNATEIEEFRKWKAERERIAARKVAANRKAGPFEPNGHTQQCLMTLRGNVVGVTGMILSRYNTNPRGASEKVFAAICNNLNAEVTRAVDASCAPECKECGYMLWPDVRQEVITVLETCAKKLREQAEDEAKKQAV